METTPQQMQVTIDELKAKKKLAEDLDKLHRNPLFKKFILNGYFDEKAKELARVAVQSSIDPTQKKIWENALIGISSLQSHFHAIYVEGNAAVQALDEYEAELLAMQSEGEA